MFLLYLTNVCHIKQHLEMFFFFSIELAFSIKITLKRDEFCGFWYHVDPQVQIIYAKSV